jgi:hypothetical protein
MGCGWGAKNGLMVGLAGSAIGTLGILDTVPKLPGSDRNPTSEGSTAGDGIEGGGADSIGGSGATVGIEGIEGSGAGVAGAVMWGGASIGGGSAGGSLASELGSIGGGGSAVTAG